MLVTGKCEGQVVKDPCGVRSIYRSSVRSVEMLLNQTSLSFGERQRADTGDVPAYLGEGVGSDDGTSSKAGQSRSCPMGRKAVQQVQRRSHVLCSKEGLRFELVFPRRVARSFPCSSSGSRSFSLLSLVLLERCFVRVRSARL